MPERSTVTPSSRLATLLGFQASDPGNLSLLSEAAEVALSEDQVAIAADLLGQYAEIAALPDREKNLAGLTALRSGKFGAAADLFGELARNHPQNPALQFNLAWSLAMTGRLADAIEKLDDKTVTELPQAAALRVQLLHDMGEFEAASALAEEAAKRYPDHPGLLAATSVLALDMDNVALARATAEKAGQHPDALSTLGILSLADDDRAAARGYFNGALSRNEGSARAQIGLGLVQLAEGDTENALIRLQRGAEIFKEHVGSWIATGWAYVLLNRLAEAEACFTRACDLDHNFAESHGSLAVLKFLAGQHEEATRLAAIARKLDSRAWTSALAQALSQTAAGNEEAARAIIARAMNAPITQDGRTLAQVMARMATGR